MFVIDIKIMGAKNFGFIRQSKEKLTAVFKIVDIGPINFYLSLKVNRDYKIMTIKSSQPA